MTMKVPSDDEAALPTGALWFRASAALLSALLRPLEAVAQRVLDRLQGPVPPEEWPRTAANGLGLESAAFAEKMAQLLRDHGRLMPRTRITAAGLQGRVDAARALEPAMDVLDSVRGLLHRLWAIHLGAARREANEIYRLARVMAEDCQDVAHAIAPIRNRRKRFARKSARTRRSRRPQDGPAK